MVPPPLFIQSTEPTPGGRGGLDMIRQLATLRAVPWGIHA